MRRGESHHAPEQSASVLLLVDVIHDFRCVDGSVLYEQSRSIVAPLRALRAGARRRRLPVIYANDHFGRWRSSFADTLARATKSPRGELARRLRPAARDLTVLKPGRSAFYASPLDDLLQQMAVDTLIVAGVSTDQCVLATVSDAVLRKYRCFVPSDCSASLSRARHERALAVLRDAFEVDTRSSDAIPWSELSV